jgi:branched-chain amino acid transport system permease protein
VRPLRNKLPYVAGVVFAAACALIVWHGGYLLTVLAFTAVYTIFVIGINFFMGYTGQVSFGQNAFAALGGYLSAVLTATYGWNLVAALLFAGACSAAMAFVVGWPTLKLRGQYLAMATLALGMITFEISVQWQSVTGGYMGIPDVPTLSESNRVQVVLLLAVMLAFMWAASRLQSWRFGRALGAIAGDEDAAMALGINPLRYKLAAFVVAGVCASVAGSLLVHFIGFVSPELFGLHMVILGFTMLYVGSIRTLLGPLVGAALINFLPETFRALKDYQDLGYGAALIVLLIFAPRGLASLFDLLQTRKPTADVRARG